MELFSDSVSQSFCQIFGSQAEGQAQVIGMIDSFVDVMNSRFKFHFGKDNICSFGEFHYNLETPSHSCPLPRKFEFSKLSENFHSSFDLSFMALFDSFYDILLHFSS